MAVHTRSQSASFAIEQSIKKKKTTPKPRKTTPKPKTMAEAKSGKLTASELAESCDITRSPPSKKHRTSKARKEQDVEKRLRRFREHAPKSYTDRLERAQSQRFVYSLTRLSVLKDCLVGCSSSIELQVAQVMPPKRQSNLQARPETFIASPSTRCQAVLAQTTARVISANISSM